MATTIATGALKPKLAVTIAALLNFVGAFISLKVAATIAGGIVDASVITPAVVFGGLIGAIAWNLATWWFGLPSSSSHALIGGMIGSGFVADGARGVHSGGSAINGDGIVEKVIIPALIAPTLAFTVAGISILVAYRVAGRQRPGVVNRGYRLGQDVTGCAFFVRPGAQTRAASAG